MILDLLDVRFQSFDQLIGLESIKFGYAFDANFCEACNIIIGYRAQQMLGMRFEAFVNGPNNFFPRFTLFDVAVDSVLDEYLLQGGKMPLLL